jgi:hypothetical protein
MEDQLVQLLSATQTAQEGPRKHAEQQLLSYYGHQELPLGLVSIACHDNVPLNIRQAALLYMKQLVLAGWSSSFEEYKGLRTSWTASSRRLLDWWLARSQTRTIQTNGRTCSTTSCSSYQSLRMASYMAH